MSVSGLPNILLIIADDRRGWRQRNGDFRRCKHPDTAIARRAGRAALRCPDKVNRGTPRLAHVIDLYQTISTLAGTEIGGADEDIDSRDLEPLFRDSGLQPEVRAYNFSQAFKQRRGEVGATIRNLGYKLNHDVTRDSVYSLCRYVGVEVPGSETEGDDGELVAEDIFAAAMDGTDADAQTALDGTQEFVGCRPPGCRRGRRSSSEPLSSIGPGLSATT